MSRLIPVFMMLLVGVIPFIAAGRLDLPYVWAILACQLCVLPFSVAKLDPGLLRERLRPGPGGVDRRLRRYAAPFLFVQLIGGGLDVGRLHWSDSVPPALQLAGVLCAVGGLVLSVWAVTVNRFFSPVVRIQSERGHHVIDSGPYAWVRHPGYLGALLGMPGWSLAIGSWWSLAPAAVVFALMLRRVAIEDRYLHEHLPGYSDYARRVRARLLPGVW